MALYQHKVIADEPDGNGIVRGRILDEMEEIPCEHCGSESMPQRCATDRSEERRVGKECRL